MQRRGLKAADARHDMVRPRCVLENHEDELYHERTAGQRETEPEYYAFLGRSWVFNRAMRWLDGPGGTVVCLSQADVLRLTGEGAASEWFSDPANEVTQEGANTCFLRRAVRRRDCVVLPGFQFNLERYPTARLEVHRASTDWQMCVMVKGRSGPPVLTGPWQSGGGAMRFELLRTLRERGYDLHFAELFFVVGLWSPTQTAEEAIEFSLWLEGVPSVVPCLPVVRTEQVARTDGVPISAAVVDAHGTLLGADQVGLVARVRGVTTHMHDSNGLWSAVLPGLQTGDHVVRFASHGAIEAETASVVRVTDGHFIGYDPDCRSLTWGGAPTGPLSGSYHGLVHVAEVGMPTEAMVLGQAEFDWWDRSAPPGEHWHYWEALTETELSGRFHHLAENGWNLLHLCQHWGLWEKLDAGGRIAPHGAEQVALVYRVAARHGLKVIQALSHYPYDNTGSDGRHTYTLPYRQYLEAGYRREDWTDVHSAFTERFHGYLQDYTKLFRDESALAVLTTSGEGDCKARRERVNDTARFVKESDPNHLFLSEPVFRMDRLPAEYYSGWEQPLFGSRLYWVGSDFEPELDLGIEFKLMQLGPIYMAEGSWPCPHLYADFMGQARTWAASKEYRTRVRDRLYLGLVHRIPILLTWEEQLTEDEHRLVDGIRRQTDWSIPFMDAPVAIRVANEHLGKQRRVLRDYEATFSAWPLATRYTLPGENWPETALVTIDATDAFTEPAFVSAGGCIPDAVRDLMPLVVSDEFRSSYSWSRDRCTLLAYVYNAAAHLICDYRASLGGRFHRLGRPAALRVSLQRFPETDLVARVYDLGEKTLVREQAFRRELSLDMGHTDSDFFILVVPGGMAHTGGTEC